MLSNAAICAAFWWHGGMKRSRQACCAASQRDGASSGVKRSTPRIANVQQPTGDVIQDVRNLIDTANSHSNVLNDLVLAASTDPGEERRERDRPLLAELKNEMLQVKDMFPGLLEQLSTLKTPESEQLMVQALEAHEQIEVCLDMERQVCCTPYTSPFTCMHGAVMRCACACML